MFHVIRRLKSMSIENSIYIVYNHIENFSNQPLRRWATFVFAALQTAILPDVISTQILFTIMMLLLANTFVIAVNFIRLV